MAQIRLTSTRSSASLFNRPYSGTDAGREFAAALQQLLIEHGHASPDLPHHVKEVHEQFMKNKKSPPPQARSVNTTPPSEESTKGFSMATAPPPAPDLLQRAHDAVQNLDTAGYAGAEIRTFLFGGEEPTGALAPHPSSLIDLLAVICDKSEALVHELNMIRARICDTHSDTPPAHR